MARLSARLVRERQAASACPDRVACARADTALADAVARAERAGLENRELATALTTLATLRRTEGRPAEADGLLDRATAVLTRVLAADERTLGPDHPETIATLEDLARIHVERHHHAEAAPLLERLVAVGESRLGRTSPAFDQRLELLATTYASEHRDADAERVYHRLVAVREEALGPNDPKVGAALDGIAESCLRQGRTSEAEAYWIRALSIEEPALRADTPVVVVEFLVVVTNGGWRHGAGWPREPVRALEGLETIYRDEDRDPEMRTLLERALASREQRLGPDHPFVGTVLERLAEVNERLGAYRLADGEYRRLLAIKEKRLGPEDPQLAEALRHHATVLWKLRRNAEAEDVDRRAASCEHHALMDSNVPGGTPPQPARVYLRPAPLD